jgi:uncharacterized protein
VEFVNSARIPAPRARVWAFLMDIEAVGRCVPGVDRVQQVDDNTYRGAMRIKVGPIGLRLEGDLVLEDQDEAVGVARMRARAADRKVSGGVNARMTIQVIEVSPSETELVVTTDATVLGKLGEFGQPLMRKKGDSIMAEFAGNVATQVVSSPDASTTARPAEEGR